MKNKSEVQFAEPGNRQGDTPASKPVDRHRFPKQATGALAIFLLCSGFGPARDDSRRGDSDNSPNQLREFVGEQVDGIQTLMVPDDAHLPQARLPDGTLTSDPRFQPPEAKRYLGKLTFFDPVTTARIIPSFGGVLATRQTGSCGSCHLGEVAGKSGTLINLNVGGEGRPYTAAAGNLIPRRRPRAPILPPPRHTPLFPGDALVDALPTLTDVYLVPPPPGHDEVDNPARGEKLPTPLQLLATGRLDALDSVGRDVP